MRAPGFPGLERPSSSGAWQIRATRGGVKYRFSTRCRSLEAAQRIYVEWELDANRVASRFAEKTRHPATLGKLVDAYQHSKSARLARASADSLSQAMRGLVARLGHQTSVRTITRAQIQEYVHDMRAWLAPNTVRLNAALIRGFALWLVREEVLERDIARDLDLPPETAALPARSRYVEAGDVAKLVAQLRKDERPEGAAAIVILHGAALRVAELGRIEPEDVRVGASVELFIRRSKGGKARVTPLVGPVVDAAAQWAIWRSDGGALPPRTLRDWMEGAAKRAGIEYFAPHALRHTAIARWLREDRCDPYDVMRWVGHENLKQTLDYLPEALRAVRLPGAVG